MHSDLPFMDRLCYLLVLAGTEHIIGDLLDRHEILSQASWLTSVYHTQRRFEIKIVPVTRGRCNYLEN